MTGTAVASERHELRFGRLDVTLVRAADLAAHVDAERLLAAGDPDEEPPYWMHLWPGALAAARRLAEGSALAAVRMLELGCGMGLPSLVAARRGARVVCTDRQWPALRMVCASARANGVTVSPLQMDWRGWALRGGFDLVVGADIAYDADDEVPLVQAIAGSLAAGGRFLLADSVNIHRNGLRESLLAAGMTVCETLRAESEDGRTVWVRCLEGGPHVG